MITVKESCVDMGKLDTILSSTGPNSSFNLIPALQQIQNAYGYLPAEVLGELCRRTGISQSRVYGIATFYEQFHLTPHGRHTIKCCRGTACHVRGASAVIEAIEDELGIKAGGTTDNMEFSFETVACLGVCALAPVVVINDKYYGQMTPGKVRKALCDFKAKQATQTTQKEAK